MKQDWRDADCGSSSLSDANIHLCLGPSHSASSGMLVLWLQPLCSPHQLVPSAGLFLGLHTWAPSPPAEAPSTPPSSTAKLLEGLPLPTSPSLLRLPQPGHAPVTANFPWQCHHQPPRGQIWYPLLSIQPLIGVLPSPPQWPSGNTCFQVSKMPPSLQEGPRSGPWLSLLLIS